MNVKTIENEINHFEANFFKDITKVVEDNHELIDRNKLLQPKENYVIVIDFLNSLIKQFEYSDSRVMSDTLSLLQEDVNNLYDFYKDKSHSIGNASSVFKQFIEQSYIDKKNLQKYLLTNKEFQNIFFDIFKEIFARDQKYILDSLLIVLNSKVYYLDRLLWLEVSKSDKIMQSLHILDSSITDSKNYLIHKIAVTPTISKDYKYLQQCLRIYK